MERLKGTESIWIAVPQSQLGTNKTSVSTEHHPGKILDEDLYADNETLAQEARAVAVSLSFSYTRGLEIAKDSLRRLVIKVGGPKLSVEEMEVIALNSERYDALYRKTSSEETGKRVKGPWVSPI